MALQLQAEVTPEIELECHDKSHCEDGKSAAEYDGTAPNVTLEGCEPVSQGLGQSQAADVEPWSIADSQADEGSDRLDAPSSPEY